MNGSTGSERPRIVVGADGSDGSKHALRWGAQQAELTGADVEAIIAWHYPAFFGWAAYPDSTDFADCAKQTLDQGIKEVFGAGEPPWLRTRVVQGNAALVLVEASKGAELLVVGSRGYGGFTDALLGSVSTYCVHHAHGPVTVIRPR